MFNNQKGIAHILFIFILLLGIIAGVYLSQKTQIFKPKASEDSPIQIVDRDGRPITETDDSSVYLKIKLPPGWVLTDQTSSGLVKEAIAQNNCSNEAPYNGKSCQNNPPTAGPEGTEIKFDNCGDNYKWCDGNCCRYTGTIDANGSLPSSSEPASVHVATIMGIENIDKDNSTGGASVIVVPGSDAVNQLVYWRLNSLNTDQDQAIRTVEVILADTNNLLDNDKNKSKYERAYKASYKASITLTRPKPSTTPSSGNNPSEPKKEIKQYQTNFYIHEGLNVYKSQVESWVHSSVKSINDSFSVSGVNKMLKVGNMGTFGGEGCPSKYLYGDTCGTTGAINVYIYPFGLRNDLSDGTGNPLSSTIGMHVNYGDVGSNFTALLAHEVGHMFSAPDYYLEAVGAENNPIAHMDILPFQQDVMFDQRMVHIDNKVSYYSDLTKDYLNKFIDIPPVGYSNPTIDIPQFFTPANITLRITDDRKVAIDGVRVEVFPEVAGDKNKPNKIGNWVLPTYYRISTKSNLEGQTDKEGKFALGNYRKIFQLDDQNIIGFSAVVRITKDNEERFMALTRSYLNSLYFKGQFQEALITVPFNSLAQYKTDVPVQTLSVPGVQFNTQQTESESTLPLRDNFDYVNEPSMFIPQ